MQHFSIPLYRLIEENLSRILDFCLSHDRLQTLVNDRGTGIVRYLYGNLSGMSERRANKAALQLAGYVRLLADRDDIAQKFDEAGTWNLGRLVRRDAPDTPLTMRQVVSMIIQSASLEWHVTDPEQPVLWCTGYSDDNWLRAEVQIASVVAFCAELMMRYAESSE